MVVSSTKAYMEESRVSGVLWLKREEKKTSHICPIRVPSKTYLLFTFYNEV